MGHDGAGHLTVRVDEAGQARHGAADAAGAGVGAGAAALRRDAARELAIGAALLVVAGLVAMALAGFSAAYLPKALGWYALGAVLVWRALPGSHPHVRFGAANRVTLVRLGVGALLAAIVGEALPRPEPIAWAIVVIATLSAVADAFDGPLARRSGLASGFGARFDMETDAAYTLVLCALVLQFDKAGPWVLAAGLMRYAFVAAAVPWPWLNGPLAPSWRRKAVCVGQITVLIVCLGPIVSRELASALAAVTLLALAASFAVDVRALARARRPSRPFPAADGAAPGAVTAHPAGGSAGVKETR